MTGSLQHHFFFVHTFVLWLGVRSCNLNSYFFELGKLVLDMLNPSLLEMCFGHADNLVPSNVRKFPELVLGTLIQRFHFLGLTEIDQNGLLLAFIFSWNSICLEACYKCYTLSTVDNPILFLKLLQCLHRAFL